MSSQLAIVEQLMPRVVRMAERRARSLPPNVELEDLIQEAMIGLLEAARRLRPDLSAGEQTYYLMLRAEGALVDSLRAKDATPRSSRRFHKEVDHAWAELKARGIDPTDSRLAEKLGISVRELHDLKWKRKLVQVDSMEAPLRDSEGSMSVGDTVAGDDGRDQDEVFDEEFEAAVAWTVSGWLPATERACWRRRALGSSLREIGTELGFTESRACQLVASATKRMKRMAENEKKRGFVPGGTWDRGAYVSTKWRQDQIVKLVASDPTMTGEQVIEQVEALAAEAFPGKKVSFGRGAIAKVRAEFGIKRFRKRTDVDAKIYTDSCARYRLEPNPAWSRVVPAPEPPKEEVRQLGRSPRPPAARPPLKVVKPPEPVAPEPAASEELPGVLEVLDLDLPDLVEKLAEELQRRGIRKLVVSSDGSWSAKGAPRP